LGILYPFPCAVVTTRRGDSASHFFLWCTIHAGHSKPTIRARAGYMHDAGRVQEGSINGENGIRRFSTCKVIQPLPPPCPFLSVPPNVLLPLQRDCAKRRFEKETECAAHPRPALLLPKIFSVDSLPHPLLPAQAHFQSHRFRLIPFAPPHLLSHLPGFAVEPDATPTQQQAAPVLAPTWRLHTMYPQNVSLQKPAFCFRTNFVMSTCGKWVAAGSESENVERGGREGRRRER